MGKTIREACQDIETSSSATRTVTGGGLSGSLYSWSKWGIACLSRHGIFGLARTLSLRWTAHLCGTQEGEYKRQLVSLIRGIR